MLTPANLAPSLSLPLIGGGTWDIAEQSPENFTIVVFYRGQHCPICKKYLQELESAMDDFAAIGATLLAVTMDGADRAKTTWDEVGLTKLPVAYDMSAQTAQDWGLFLSSKRPGTQEPDVFAEPGLAVLRADGTVFFTQIQNAPFTRPPLDQLLGGLTFVIKNDYPTRGTYVG